MVQNLVGAGVLLAIGYLVGKDGGRQLVVVPCSPDGRQAQLPNLTEARLEEGLPRPPRRGAGWDLETAIERLTQEGIRPYGTSTTYYLDALFDARRADKVVFYVDSTCDQALTVQVVGSMANGPSTPTALVNIEASQTLAAGSSAASRLSLGIDLEINWHFFLGVTIASGGTPPTTGRVTVMAAIRRWVKIGD